MQLDFIIIGAQKAGSTFVHTICNEHPDVWVAKNEVAVFENPDFLEGGMQDLKKILSKSPDVKSKGIKRPVYLTKPECPGNISGQYPEAKLIMVLRNPVDRFISAYYHYILTGFIPAVDINDGAHHLLNGDYDDRFPRSKEVVEFGFYGAYITLFLEHFRQDQLLILIYEDIKKDPQKFADQIFEFLGVSTIALPGQVLASRPMKGVYAITPGRVSLNKLKNSICYRRNADNTRLYPRKNIFSKAVGRMADWWMAKYYGGSKPKIDPDLRKQLTDIYQPDIEKLEQILGRKLSVWSAK